MKSLVKEINAAIVITLVVVSILFGVVYFSYQKREQVRFLEDRLFLLQTFKKSEERSLVDYLFERNPDALRLELERMLQTSDFLALAVYDAEGALMAGVPDGSFSAGLDADRRTSLREEAGVSRSGSWQGKTALDFIAPFHVIEETMGYFQIIASLEDLEEHGRTTFGFFLLLLGTLLGTSLVLLNLLLSRLVTRPIRSLVRTTGEVERGNWTARAGISRNDEIGRLNESFNRMVGRLQGSFGEI